MTESMIDNGLTRSQLWAGAWLLGVLSLASWLYLAKHLGGSGSWDSPAVVALAAAVTCSVFSACCALLVAIKSSETRVRRRLSVLDVPGPP